MKLVLTILLVFLLATTCEATNLRGQVLRYNAYTRTYFPLSGVRVDLWIFNGQQWVDLSYAVTGPDGSYFFLNLAPGILFRLQVFGNFFPPQPLSVLQIYPPNFQILPNIIT